MRYHDIQLTGSLSVTGSLSIPNHPNTGSATSLTGSIYHDTTDGVIRVYNGTQWQVVGEQTASAAGGGGAGASGTAIEYLLVAGGGAGGSGFYGAGGGAGGLLSSSLASVVSGSSFTITVGSGGSSGTTTSGGRSGGDGNDSSIAGATISTITSTGGGGGGGGGATTSTTADVTGNDGGSGGGAAQNNPYTSGPGSGTVGQGNDGGDTNVSGYGAGGGGASAAGGSGTSSGGNGGDGKQSNITGTATYYAGGGGGADNSGTGGTGGQGGGATGDDRFSGTPGAGTANTGGGGAGAGDVSEAGGAGGSGVVIFAYDSGSINCAGGIIGDAGNGRKYNQFNSSGTFKVGNTSTDFDNIVTDSLSVNLDAGNFASRGTSTWTDLQGNYNGTVNGSISLPDYYYDFDGTDDYVQFATGMSSLFEGQSTVSVEFWCQIDTVGSHVLFGKYASNVQVGGYQFNTNGSGQPNFFVANSSDQRLTANASTALSANTWTHLVYIFDGSQSISNGTGGRLQAFKDTTELSMTYGITTNHTTIPTTSTTGVKQNRLGVVNFSDGSGAYLAGKIAQFRVYSKVLTAAEITQNYNATKTNFV